MSITESILRANGGDRRKAAAVLAHGLMVGNASELKLGYSRAAALLFAEEMYGPFDPETTTFIGTLLDARLQVYPVQHGPDSE